ncbi:hypothetical protein [Actinomadura macrotermitis]|uniref:Uncharacterized protein n=1 Tax=Actinomadura macrotermitis TaxID=2585200 RepID=A0A7K0BR57_9ACTN|nr:hypothetical protein [Actinomadura macrotermitis]MQY03214.1 hypothetical protein [Actinomadura macrotermitis]
MYAYTEESACPALLVASRPEEGQDDQQPPPPDGHEPTTLMLSHSLTTLPEPLQVAMGGESPQATLSVVITNASTEAIDCEQVFVALWAGGKAGDLSPRPPENCRQNELPGWKRVYREVEEEKEGKKTGSIICMYAWERQSDQVRILPNETMMLTITDIEVTPVVGVTEVHITEKVHEQEGAKQWTNNTARYMLGKFEENMTISDFRAEKPVVRRGERVKLAWSTTTLPTSPATVELAYDGRAIPLTGHTGFQSPPLNHDTAFRLTLTYAPVKGQKAVHFLDAQVHVVDGDVKAHTLNVTEATRMIGGAREISIEPYTDYYIKNDGIFLCGATGFELRTEPTYGQALWVTSPTDHALRRYAYKHDHDPKAHTSLPLPGDSLLLIPYSDGKKNGVAALKGTWIPLGSNKPEKIAHPGYVVEIYRLPFRRTSALLVVYNPLKNIRRSFQEELEQYRKDPVAYKKARETTSYLKVESNGSGPVIVSPPPSPNVSSSPPPHGLPDKWGDIIGPIADGEYEWLVTSSGTAARAEAGKLGEAMKYERIARHPSGYWKFVSEEVEDKFEHSRPMAAFEISKSSAYIVSAVGGIFSQGLRVFSVDIGRKAVPIVRRSDPFSEVFPGIPLEMLEGIINVVPLSVVEPLVGEPHLVLVCGKELCVRYDVKARRPLSRPTTLYQEFPQLLLPARPDVTGSRGASSADRT